MLSFLLFAILQKYEFSSKSQLQMQAYDQNGVVCDTAKVRVFKQITTNMAAPARRRGLFAILQKYEFSSKSQPNLRKTKTSSSCLRYCKSTSFQANHNSVDLNPHDHIVVCDTAKVRVFKQITTKAVSNERSEWLFAILQKYEFSSKSQHVSEGRDGQVCCLRYCKSTSFQANHNA